MEACWHCQAPILARHTPFSRSCAAEEARRRDERRETVALKKSALFLQDKMKMKKMALQLYHAQPGDDVSKLQSNLANRASKEKSRAAETRKVPRSRAPPVSQLALLWRERMRILTPHRLWQGKVKFSFQDTDSDDGGTSSSDEDVDAKTRARRRKDREIQREKAKKLHKKSGAVSLPPAPFRAGSLMWIAGAGRSRS